MEIKFKNGKLERMTLSKGMGEGFGGELKIPRMIKTQMRLRPNSRKRSDSSPDYWLELPEWNGQNYDWEQCGAAWWKTPEDTSSEVDEYLSINLDAPDLPHKLNFAAFMADEEDQPKPDDGGELWRIVYNRPQAKRSKPAPENKPLLPEDGIPY